ncbi:hypothetical protein QVD17_10613 [Tagetes erecta]|uniref:Uncharacterized protein n=1 Tax=Tagetes erecta TaxID=13708 RepID=A0AAD8P4Y2_TARER|nr:hypothetical protein QVD17_10613 [Tagetes erecta]
MEELEEVGINMLNELECIIGNGSNASFWFVKWTGLGLLRASFPALFLAERNKVCKIAERFRLIGSDYHSFVTGDRVCLFQWLRSSCRCALAVCRRVMLVDSEDKWYLGGDEFSQKP